MHVHDTVWCVCVSVCVCVRVCVCESISEQAMLGLVLFGLGIEASCGVDILCLGQQDPLIQGMCVYNAAHIHTCMSACIRTYICNIEM